MEMILKEAIGADQSIKSIKAFVVEQPFELYEQMIEILSQDNRKAVQTLKDQLVKKKAAHEKECARMEMMFEFERELKSSGMTFVAGIDEV